jgi:DNA sulfur modification protein DndB
MEERQCGPKNHNLFTLSALKNANKYLLDEVKDDNLTEKYDIALKYWNKVGEMFPQWTELPGHELREYYIHGYGVILSALGLMGKYLLVEHPNDYEALLPRLKAIDWSKWNILSDGNIQTSREGKKIVNPFWNGIVMSGTVVENTTTNIRHATMILRKTLGLKLSDEEEVVLNMLKARTTE